MASDPDAALELSHAFFARLLAGGAIAQATEEQRTERTYQKARCKREQSKHVTCGFRKRGEELGTDDGC
jgi:hypothetical protein